MDEFHQLNDTEDGKSALKALVANLEDSEYARTTFIGAGYTMQVEVRCNPI